MKKLLSVMVAVALVAPIAMADDLNDPPWAGTPGLETSQGWEFDTDLDPTYVDNIYGPPTTTGGTWVDTYEGRQGIAYFEDWDEFTIDVWNADNANPRKEIWFQITYWVFDGFPSLSAEIEGWSGEATGWGGGSIDAYDLGDGWYYEAFHWFIEPNPKGETITLSSFFDDIYIDQMHIDTICIPEPGSLGLLGLIGLAALRRR